MLSVVGVVLEHSLRGRSHTDRSNSKQASVRQSTEVKRTPDTRAHTRVLTGELVWFPPAFDTCVGADSCHEADVADTLQGSCFVPQPRHATNTIRKESKPPLATTQRMRTPSCQQGVDDRIHRYVRYPPARPGTPLTLYASKPAFIPVDRIRFSTSSPASGLSHRTHTCSASSKATRGGGGGCLLSPLLAAVPRVPPPSSLPPSSSSPPHARRRRPTTRSQPLYGGKVFVDEQETNVWWGGGGSWGLNLVR